MENNPSVTYLKDETGHHLYDNTTLLNKFDISKGEFIWTTAYDLLPTRKSRAFKTPTTKSLH